MDKKKIERKIEIRKFVAYLEEKTKNASFQSDPLEKAAMDEALTWVKMVMNDYFLTDI